MNREWAENILHMAVNAEYFSDINIKYVKEC